ncbi:MAG TPA: inorganic phosphate transporter [Kofleriaceae bacterium]|nr:inorganic phosphate transporter [Kofleriaceae bacterium]
MTSAIVIVTIAAALIFDVINGFHDAANSIATVVSTRVLSPKIAVIWAAVFNFIALFIFHQGVADTISKIITVQKSEAYVIVVVCGLSGAILWNLLTWLWGLPSSSSHALIGGISGAGVTYSGFDVLQWDNLGKTLEFILLAPLIGMVLGGLLMFVVFWLFRRVRPQRVDRTFRVGQLLSAAAYSIGHGGNDAQKTIGVIWAVMIAGGMLDAGVAAAPSWVVIASYSAMKLNTAAQITAILGDSTRVDTTVAIEFAASWKPLITSKISAAAIVTTTMAEVMSAPAYACSRITPSMMFATSSHRSVADSRFS